MPMPKVSILLPVRNAAVFLPEAIASLDAQTFCHWECLAIDDGSTDSSSTLLECWQQRDERVRIIKGHGKGIVQALNRALALASAPLIARMDADDISLPGRLEQQVHFLSTHPDIIACGTGALMIDPAGRALCPINPPQAHDTIMDALLRGGATAIVHPTLMVRKKPLEAIHGYREPYRHVEDYDLYLRLSDCGKLANLGDILLHYRQHPSSANVTQRLIQRELRLSALNDYRRSRDLDDMTDLPFGRQHLNSLADLYADWSNKAAIGGHTGVAMYYALRSILREWWKLKRWKLIWQAFALR